MEPRLFESLKGSLLDTEVTLPEVRLDRLDGNFLLLRCGNSRMVGLDGRFVSLLRVGDLRILQLLQNTNDLAAACLNSHHFDTSDQTWRHHLATLRERHSICHRRALHRNHFGTKPIETFAMNKISDKETRKARSPHAIRNLS